MAVKYKRRNTRNYSQKHFINNRIRVPEVRLIDENGENVGVISTREALEKAQSAELDLVLISAKANPPVAKILQYSKFLYDERKKQSASKEKSQKSETKEFIFGPTIGTGDLETRIERTREFIEAGNRVKMSVKFKGRERTHPEVGQEKIQKVIDSLKDIARIEEKEVRMKGNLLTVTFVRN